MPERRSEESAWLAFVADQCRRQADDGLAYIAEAGYRSEIWTQSPLKQLQDVGGHRDLRCDQCRFGHVNTMNEPLMKPTLLATNIKMKTAAQRCICAQRGLEHGKFLPDGYDKDSMRRMNVNSTALARALLRNY